MGGSSAGGLVGGLGRGWAAGRAWERRPTDRRAPLRCARRGRSGSTWRRGGGDFVCLSVCLFCAGLCGLCPCVSGPGLGGVRPFCFRLFNVLPAVARTRVRTYACTCKCNVYIEYICDSYVCLSLPHSPHDSGRWPGSIGAVPRRLQLDWRAAVARYWPCAGAGGGHHDTFESLGRVNGVPR